MRINLTYITYNYKLILLYISSCTVNSNRKKRSIDNPLDIIEDIKTFVSNANRLSFNDVFHNLRSNAGYVAQKLRRVSNHITSNFRYERISNSYSKLAIKGLLSNQLFIRTLYRFYIFHML